MTLGEKIKDARLKAGLTQEQFAEKLTVSRPAVTKWEADRGIPDVENLKAISQLLNVSLDYLLNDDNYGNTLNVIKEPYDISAYGKGRKKVKKDRVVRNKYPKSEIYTLFAEKIPTKGERITDNLLGFLTDAPFGIPQFLNSLKMTDTESYLVVNSGEQYLVSVTDEFIVTTRMSDKKDTTRGTKFIIGEIKYTNAGPIVYA